MSISWRQVKISEKIKQSRLESCTEIKLINAITMYKHSITRESLALDDWLKVGGCAMAHCLLLEASG